MRKELENKLIETYPELLGKHLKWGIDCDDGWYDLIESLCENIIDYCIMYDCQMPDVLQIKEKFGGLRFYTNGTFREIDKMIEDAEDESFKICEECGANKNIKMRNNNGWLKTLCDDCYHEREKHIRGYN